MVIVEHKLHPSGRGIIQSFDRLYPSTPCCGELYIKDKARTRNLTCVRCRKFYARHSPDYWAGCPFTSGILPTLVAKWLGYIPANVKVEVK